jgi:hypothetical protein
LLYDLVNGYSHRSSKEVFLEFTLKLEIIFTTEQNEKLLDCIRRYKNSGASLTKISEEIYNIIYPKMKLNFEPPIFFADTFKMLKLSNHEKKKYEFGFLGF